MTHAYSVRPAADGDLASVLRVLADNRFSRPTEPPAPAASPSDRQIAMWSRITRSPDVTVYLAESLSLYFKIELRPVLRSRNERWEAHCPGLVVVGPAADRHGREAVAAAVPELW